MLEAGVHSINREKRQLSIRHRLSAFRSSSSRFLATALALLASKLLTRLLASDGNVNCEGDDMLWTLFVILLVLWLLGVVSSYTMGGFIHILLVLAVIALVFQLITCRRAAV